MAPEGLGGCGAGSQRGWEVTVQDRDLETLKDRTPGAGDHRAWPEGLQDGRRKQGAQEGHSGEVRACLVRVEERRVGSGWGRLTREELPTLDTVERSRERCRMPCWAITSCPHEGALESNFF